MFGRKPLQEQLNVDRCCVWIGEMFAWTFFVILVNGAAVLGKSNPISFYDLKSKQILRPPTTTSLAGSENDAFNMPSVINVRLPFIGQPCK